MRVAEIARHNTEVLKRQKAEARTPRELATAHGGASARIESAGWSAFPIASADDPLYTQAERSPRTMVLASICCWMRGSWAQHPAPRLPARQRDLHHIALADVRRDRRRQDLAGGRHRRRGRIRRPFLDWGGRRQARVMYLDGEMPAETFKERMQLIAERYGSDIPFFGYNRDDLGDGAMPPLNEEDGEKWLMREIDLIKPDLIIFDSIMCLLSGVMSEEESWGPVKHLVRRITSKKIGQIWLHHTGHDGPRVTAPRPASGRWTPLCGWPSPTTTTKPLRWSFARRAFARPQNHEQFKARTLSRGPDGWSFDAMSGKPMDGRRSAEVTKLKHAIVDAYSRLTATCRDDRVRWPACQEGRGRQAARRGQAAWLPRHQGDGRHDQCIPPSLPPGEDRPYRQRQIRRE